MQERQAKQASSSPRFGSIDALKGIAIVLMVYGHIAQGGMHRHLWDAMPVWPGAIHFSDVFIYSFHMPAFFFAAGLFLAGSAKRHGTSSFVIERVKTLLYPYLLWNLLSTAILPLTAQYMVLHPKTINWRELLIGLGTGNISWFLPTLFVCQVLALLVLKLPHWLQMAIAMAACFLIPSSDVTVLSMPFQYFPFVVAGMWFSSKRLPLLDRLPKIWAWCGFAVLLGIQLALVRTFGEVTRWDRVPFGLTGIAMILLLCYAIRGSIPDQWLQWFGEASLAIYFLSTFVAGAVREILARVFHLTQPVPYLGLTTLVSVVLPALIWSWQNRLHLHWLFRWPAGKKRSVPSRPQTVTG